MRNTATLLAVVMVGVAGAGCESSGSGRQPTGGESSSRLALTVQERGDLEAVFTTAGTKGTFVLYDVAAASLTVVNRERAEREFIPASTFKIPHSLIALETGAVKDENDKIPYGGSPQPMKEWERDMGLREAIAVSNVPAYQEIARRVGPEREREWLLRLGYGNAQVGAVVDRFWLDGPLKISARAQALWLRGLAKEELNASRDNQRIVKDIAKIEQTSEYTLFAKTGTATAVTPQLGWWVGWVERGEKLYTFALNLDLGADSGPTQRITLARDLLRRLDVLPAA